VPHPSSAHSAQRGRQLLLRAFERFDVAGYVTAASDISRRSRRGTNRRSTISPTRVLVKILDRFLALIQSQSVPPGTQVMLVDLLVSYLASAQKWCYIKDIASYFVSGPGEPKSIDIAQLLPFSLDLPASLSLPLRRFRASRIVKLLFVSRYIRLRKCREYAHVCRLSGDTRLSCV
jgi:hypothetical protein